MRKRLIFICILIVCVSCKKKEVYSEYFLDSYVYEGSSAVFIVVPVGEGKYICIFNDVLREIVYVEHYQQRYDSYLSFLQILFNKLKEVEIMQYFDKDNVFEVTKSKIWAEYKKEGFDYIKNKYISEKIHENFATNLTEQTDILTIAKIMFDNNYFVFFNDYDPYFYFLKENVPIIIKN